MNFQELLNLQFRTLTLYQNEKRCLADIQNRAFFIPSGEYVSSKNILVWYSCLAWTSLIASLILIHIFQKVVPSKD
jgi:hypothetical protein